MKNKHTTTTKTNKTFRLVEGPEKKIVWNFNIRNSKNVHVKNVFNGSYRY